MARRGDKPRDTSEAIDRAVSARLERQAILQRENPPMLWHVLHEGLLRHVVGSPASRTAAGARGTTTR